MNLKKTKKIENEKYLMARCKLAVTNFIKKVICIAFKCCSAVFYTLIFLNTNIFDGVVGVADIQWGASGVMTSTIINLSNTINNFLRI